MLNQVDTFKNAISAFKCGLC